MRFQRIYWRVALPFAATLLLSTTLAWWIGTHLVARALEERVRHQLTHATEVLTAPGFPYTPEIFERLGRLLRADVVAFDHSGHLSLSTLPAGADGLTEIIQRHVAEPGPRDAEAPSVVRIREAQRPHLLVIRHGQPGEPSRYPTLALVTDLSDVGRAARVAGAWLGLAALLGMVVLAWVGDRIARTITSPIRALARMATDIAEGDRSARVQVQRADEVGELAGALNAMAVHLQSYEQQVASSSRLAAVGELAGRLAHEVRNPLTAIKMQLQLLAESLSGAQQTTVEALVGEVRRLELIVSNTLHLGRPAGLRRMPTDLNQIVTEVTRLLAPQFDHQRVVVTTALDAGLPPLSLDAGHIKQILLNLLLNAADELPDGGRIRVSTAMAEPGEEVILSVEDSGPGIPVENRDQMFSTTASDKPGGFGLGLRVCKELVGLHGGRMTIRDSTLGGACFEAALPAEDFHGESPGR